MNSTGGKPQTPNLPTLRRNLAGANVHANDDDDDDDEGMTGRSQDFHCGVVSY